MPANIPIDTYSQLKHFSESGDMRARAVFAIIEGTFTSTMKSAHGTGAVLATSGDTTFGSLPGTSLVLKISTDGGSTFPTTRTHAFAAAVKAEKSFSTVGAGHLDSVLQAHNAGLNGNLIDVTLIGDSAPASGVSVVVTPNGDGYHVTVHYESAVSTVGNVETAITALAGPNDVIDVKTPGTGATVLTAPADNSGPTLLAGGVGVETIDQIVADLTGDAAFMGATPNIAVTKSTAELVITSLNLSTGVVLKADATSTALGASKLHYTADQLSTAGQAVLTIQIVNQAGIQLSGAKDVLVRALAVAGTVSLTDAGAGSIKSGSGTAEVWCQTDTKGKLELYFSDVTSEAVIIITQTDNGEVELTKITTPLS